MSEPDDRRLRIAIAQFDAVMRQSQFAGPDGDAIDVILEPNGDEESQPIRVTYTANSVIAEHDRSGKEPEFRTGASAKVEVTFRLVRPANLTEPIQMEIDETTSPFDASDARLKIERILKDRAFRAFKAQLHP